MKKALIKRGAEYLLPLYALHDLSESDLERLLQHFIDSLKVKWVLIFCPTTPAWAKRHKTRDNPNLRNPSGLWIENVKFNYNNRLLNKPNTQHSLDYLFLGGIGHISLRVGPESRNVTESTSDPLAQFLHYKHQLSSLMQVHRWKSNSWYWPLPLA